MSRSARSTNSTSFAPTVAQLNQQLPFQTLPPGTNNNSRQTIFSSTKMSRSGISLHKLISPDEQEEEKFTVHQTSSFCQSQNQGQGPGSLIHLKRMIGVRGKMAFVYDPKNDCFSGKIKITNNIPYRVSYIVRSSKPDKFKIRPMYGLSTPGESLQISATTRDVMKVDEIVKEYFIIYAIPLRDSINLQFEDENDSLTSMWHSVIEKKSKFLPCESSPDFQNICFALPQHDKNYFNNVPLTGRAVEICCVVTKDTPENLYDRREEKLPIFPVYLVLFVCLLLGLAYGTDLAKYFSSEPKGWFW